MFTMMGDPSFCGLLILWRWIGLSPGIFAFLSLVFLEGLVRAVRYGVDTLD